MHACKTIIKAELDNMLIQTKKKKNLYAKQIYMPWYITTVEIVNKRKLGYSRVEHVTDHVFFLQATAFIVFVLRLCECLGRDLDLCMPNHFIALLHGSGNVTVWIDILQQNLTHACI